MNNCSSFAGPTPHTLLTGCPHPELKRMCLYTMHLSVMSDSFSTFSYLTDQADNRERTITQN